MTDLEKIEMFEPCDWVNPYTLGLRHIQLRTKNE
jgi:hypothetical protein